VPIVRQPQCFDDFRCIGAECEDTCCRGWGILVDSETWEKYQGPLDFRIAGNTLSSLVEINPARTSSADYAKIRLEGNACPALKDGLCSIQQVLGEPYIPDLCSTYPRVLHMTGGTIERSLHLSCPEVARLVLSDPRAMVLIERAEGPLPHRVGSLSLVAGATDERLNQVRALTIEVIKERSLPLWKRIVSLGFVVDRLAGATLTHAVTVMESHLNGLRQGLFEGIFASRQSAPAFQLETVLELIVARLKADYTSPRFLECYSEFMRGLAWTNESTMEELAARYHHASGTHFQRFVRGHEHLFENYLIQYIFRTLFPYGRKQPNQTFAIDSGAESMKQAFLLLAVHFATIRTVMIGMAALHKDNLGIDHAIKLVQSYSKSFLHSSSFEAVAIELLGKTAESRSAESRINTVAALLMD
jgi:lysine-N-methylase